MAAEWLAPLLLLHLVSTLLMAAPFYMLVVVNERARFAIPPGYDTDRYMENIIKAQPQRCYAFLAVILVTGVALTWGAGYSLASTLTNLSLLTKIAVFLVLVSLLSYVHFGIQPRIERLLAGLAPGRPVPDAERPRLVRLRIRRKRLSAICLFLVLTEVIMGVRVFNAYSPLLTSIFLVAAAFFAWRAYRRPVVFGWF
ncbi:MAG: hypothetical protein M1370_00925 [Bacteroidetes bacterium]|nr:hypothetical protein [Bacteroidota bacterium]MCL5025545.1 hypothetical protein [Chloroflexota bacterium]